MKNLMIAIVLIHSCLGDASHILPEYLRTTTTPQSPPRPYSIQYQAGRHPGNVDRVHEESGDGFGHIRGSYSFIDPEHKVRTVQYAVDENGFHTSLINYEDTVAQPVESEAVKLATENHLRLYQKIGEANTHSASENVLRDSSTAGRARNIHLQLYQKIAKSHAAIAAQREAGHY
ncbi:hypothetical protein ANTQUA_LOCUS5057 [Anthophora quadrimaculata]